MIIDRLVLKNFKRFRHEEIRFQDGITGILGNNGTGKSSIVQAIFFALYGVQATGIAADYIVSGFASPKERCEVRLDFSVGGEKYAVVRTFRKGKTVQHDAEFYRAGKMMAKGVGPVEAEVRRTLGMGPVDFKNTIYAGQKDLLTLLETTPGKRKEWFLKALGIDYLSAESQKILKERADKAESDRRLLEGELVGMRERQNPDELARLETTVADTKKEIAALETGKAAHAGKKAKAEAAIKDFTARKVEHARHLEKKDALLREQANLAKQKGDLEKRLAALSAQEQEFRTLERQVALYPEKKQQLEQAREQKAQADRFAAEQQFAARERTDLAARMEKLRQQLARFDKDAESAAGLRAEIRAALRIVGTVPDAGLDTLAAAKSAEVSRSLGTCAARQERLLADREKLLRDKATIEAAGADGTCPLCRQKLGTHYGGIEKEFAAQLAAIHDEAVSVLAATEKMEKEKADLDGIAPKLAGLRALADAQKQRETTERELADLAKASQEKEAAGRELAGRIAALGFDPAAYAAAEKAVADLEQVQARYSELARQAGAGRRGAGPARGHKDPDRGERGGTKRGRCHPRYPSLRPAAGSGSRRRARAGHRGSKGDRRRSCPGRRTPETRGREDCGDQTRPGKGHRARSPDRGRDRRDRTPETDTVGHRRLRHLPYAGRAEPDRRRGEPDRERDHRRAVRAGAPRRGLQPPHPGR